MRAVVLATGSCREENGDAQADGQAGLRLFPEPSVSKAGQGQSSRGGIEGVELEYRTESKHSGGWYCCFGLIFRNRISL